jgi:hypothetical protein
MRIPEIAERLRDLAAERGLPELTGLADELRRRPSGDRAPRRSQRMTDALAEQLRACWEANPHLSQAEIGRIHNVNPGRVSEAVRGKRT